MSASLLAGCCTAGAAAAFLSEYGIEGMHMVSTPASEVRATVSHDGRWIVWGSRDREGGAGGGDLWRAELIDGRWQDPQPLSLNSPGEDLDPAFAADGRWLYFASDRKGGAGGHDLYRAPVGADGSVGPQERLPGPLNTRGNESSPVPTQDGRHLLFASDGHGGAGGLDLFVSQWQDGEWGEPRALEGINTAADEMEATWLGSGTGIVFTRSSADGQAMRLQLARCQAGGFVEAGVLELSFNTPEDRTRGPGVDWNKPAELLVSGIARAPRAGGTDIYRMKAPAVDGSGDCLP
ncbi:TolB family protein [Novilysobacter spongiicola]|uniref:WD40-like Beta Propeller Repeat n=1 Tax=Lysobacter spongiicola DSM 21749 TaxID=1122188 RepID=A0A1T4S403_9GAMM|nr:PD40 domain-containing protein [Lysobacter spongiicola]SKA22857.1 WD40-like Beta Propeller Repeat [Lysobacter spongiicola DSM 21749]